MQKGCEQFTERGGSHSACSNLLHVPRQGLQVLTATNESELNQQIRIRGSEEEMTHHGETLRVWARRQHVCVNRVHIKAEIERRQSLCDTPKWGDECCAGFWPVSPITKLEPTDHKLLEVGAVLSQVGERSGSELKSSDLHDPGVVLEDVDPLLGEGSTGRAWVTQHELSETCAFGGNDLEDGTPHGDAE